MTDLSLPFSSLTAQISPFASRTLQYTKEQLGQADDKVVFSVCYQIACDLLSNGVSRPNFLPNTSILRSGSTR